MRTKKIPKLNLIKFSKRKRKLKKFSKFSSIKRKNLKKSKIQGGTGKPPVYIGRHFTTNISNGKDKYVFRAETQHILNPSHHPTAVAVNKRNWAGDEMSIHSYSKEVAIIMALEIIKNNKYSTIHSDSIITPIEIGVVNFSKKGLKKLVFYQARQENNPHDSSSDFSDSTKSDDDTQDMSKFKPPSKDEIVAFYDYYLNEDRIVHIYETFPLVVGTTLASMQMPLTQEVEQKLVATVVAFGKKYVHGDFLGGNIMYGRRIDTDTSGWFIIDLDQLRDASEADNPFPDNFKEPTSFKALVDIMTKRQMPDATYLNMIADTLLGKTHQREGTPSKQIGG